MCFIWDSAYPISITKGGTGATSVTNAINNFGLNNLFKTVEFTFSNSITWDTTAGVSRTATIPITPQSGYTPLGIIEANSSSSSLIPHNVRIKSTTEVSFSGWLRNNISAGGLTLTVKILYIKNAFY